MVLSVSVQAKLQQSEHDGLIFIQCKEKTSLDRIGHRHGVNRLREPYAGLGNWDNMVAKCLKPVFSCFSNSIRKLLMASSISSWSRLASMRFSLCGSGAAPGADCAGGGSCMSLLCHEILHITMLAKSNSGISQIILSSKTKN